MYVRFGYKMPDYLAPGESTPIYLDMANDADYKVRFYVDFYYSTDRGATWNKFAHDEYLLDAGKAYTNLQTTVDFTMPDASEAILNLTWKARKINPDGTIGEVVASGDDYHTIERSTGGGGVDIESALMQELKKWYKKNVTVPGVTGSYDWSFDVTNTVIESGLIENVDKAYLYGWYEIRSYSYAGKERPPDRPPQEIVSGWLNGIELALLRISTADYNIPEEYAGHYWVTVPCKLVVVQKEAPKASIVKDLSKYPDGLGGIIYNGQPLEPNKEHPVPKGSKVEYFAFAQNIGGPGDIWIRLLVNGVEVDRAEGTSPAISGTITVNDDITLKFEAGHGDVVDDEWGC